MDIGMKDFTALVFGYYDFRQGKIIIEEELLTRGADLQLPKLSKQIDDIERLLWSDTYGEVKRPIKRVSDHNLIVLSELYRISEGVIKFSPVKKEEIDIMINNLRVLLEKQRIIIHPRCTNLIRHISKAKWSKNKSKSEFTRDAIDGHYDLLSALVYFVRSVDLDKNPYPRQIISEHEYFNRNNRYNYDPHPKAHETSDAQIETFKRIFNVKSPRRSG
jgi:hypothetical protein